MPEDIYEIQRQKWCSQPAHRLAQKGYCGKNPASRLVPLRKALNGIPPLLCGRKAVGLSSTSPFLSLTKNLQAR